MIYQTQAVNARVDMTLCFFVTLSLILFYSIYRGFLSHPLWPYAMYLLVGLATLSKGPLGIVLPGLVIAVFLALKRDWKQFFKFALHPGVLIALVLVVGWYGLAISRGGEGFVNRQLLSENLGRFFGGSGHSHPIYYYLGYLFSLAIAMVFVLSVHVLGLGQESAAARGDDLLFLQTWFGVMLDFFLVVVRQAGGLPLADLSGVGAALGGLVSSPNVVGSFFGTWFLRIVSGDRRR